MDASARPTLLGQYQVVRTLPAGRLSRRWLAVHQGRQSVHVVHEVPISGARADRLRVLTLLGRVAELDHPHLVPVERFGLLDPGRVFVITPYTGDQEGLRDLPRLLADKGGRMSPAETARAVEHLFRAVEFAHARDLVHGPVQAREVLVDRGGSLRIELYAMAQCIVGDAQRRDELRREEVRSIVELAYTMLTGLAPDEPRITPSRIVRRLDRRWDLWLDRGLDPMRGFASATEAIEQLEQSRTAASAPAVARVRDALIRVRWNVGRSPGRRV